MSAQRSPPVTATSSPGSSQPTPPKKSKNAAKRARAAAVKAAAAAAAEDATDLPGVEPEPEIEDAEEAEEGGEPAEEAAVEAEETAPAEPQPQPTATEEGEDPGVGEQLPSGLTLEDHTPKDEVGDEFFEAEEVDASSSAVQAAEATIELVNLAGNNGVDHDDQLNLERSPPQLATLDQPPVPALEDECSSTNLSANHSPTLVAANPACPASPNQSFPSDFPSSLSTDHPPHPEIFSHAHLHTESPSSITPPPSAPPTHRESLDQLSPLTPLSLDPSPSASPFARERHFSLESEPETPTGPISLATMMRKGSLPGLERKASVSGQPGEGEGGFADVSLAEAGVSTGLAEIPAWNGKGKGRAVDGDEHEYEGGEGSREGNDLPGLPTPRRHSSDGSLDSSGYMFLMQRLEAQ